jgi:hypothetical protein
MQSTTARLHYTIQAILQGNRIGRSSLFVFIRGCFPFVAAGSEWSGNVV